MRKWKGYSNTLALVLAVFMAGCCKNDGNKILGINSILPVGPVPAAIPLGAAGTFRVLGGTTVTNVPSVGTIVTGDVGVWPGNTVTGFGAGQGVVNGGFAIYAGVAPAPAAQGALTTAYNAAAALAPGASVSGNIGGLTLAPGTYTSSSSLAISSGDLTLAGNSSAVWVFQIGSTLTVTSGRKVILAGGADPANIYWQVGSSATIGTTADFSGTIMSNVSISLLTGAKLHGRALARTGAVSLETNLIGP